MEKFDASFNKWIRNHWIVLSLVFVAGGMATRVMQLDQKVTDSAVILQEVVKNQTKLIQWAEDHKKRGDK
jgi:hypothetical protein